MFCKTIILSNSQNINSNAPKGILTLSNQNNTTIGKIRLYNIISLPQGTKIGLYINERVHIANLIKRPQHYEFDLEQNINLNNSIYCALIDNSKGDKQVILEGGSFNGFYFTDSPFDAILESKDEELERTIDDAIKDSDSCPCDKNCGECEYKKYFYDNYDSSTIDDKNLDDINNNTPSATNNAPSPENNTILEINNSPYQNEDLNINIYDDSICNEELYLSKDIQNIEDTNLLNPKNEEKSSVSSKEVEEYNVNDQECDKKEVCVNQSNVQHQKYSEQNSANINKENSQNLENESLTEVNEEQNQFLNDIIYQLDEMFVKYPADEVLNSIIPDSRFIKVENENTQPYVLGVIYENKMMKYISYGVPAKYNSLPPADLGQNYQWLPLNPEDVMSDGYYLIYQNALTGKIVELTIE